MPLVFTTPRSAPRSKGKVPTTFVAGLSWDTIERQRPTIVISQRVLKAGHLPPNGRARRDIVRQLSRKSAEQTVSGRNSPGSHRPADRSRIGAAGHAQLRSDEFPSQLEACVIPVLLAQDRHQFCLGIGLLA